MTMKTVCDMFNISADTLRYYERIGVIPPVQRTSGGIRKYADEDISWIQNAICLRDAGVPLEMIAEYVRLYDQGEPTYEARLQLLERARVHVMTEKQKYDAALEKLNYKISKYEEAVKTGVLIWDENVKCDNR